MKGYWSNESGTPTKQVNIGSSAEATDKHRWSHCRTSPRVAQTFCLGWGTIHASTIQGWRSTRSNLSRCLHMLSGMDATWTQNKKNALGKLNNNLHQRIKKRIMGVSGSCSFILFQLEGTATSAGSCDRVIFRWSFLFSANRYSLICLCGIHFGLEGSDMQMYPHPQVIKS